MTPALPVLLLAEDEAMIADLLETSLQEAGFEVVTAMSGGDAIKQFEDSSERFCGVITDIRMPGGPDGWDVGKRAREITPNIPVVYISGDSEGDWTSKGVPGSVMITKPFAPIQIATAISSLLNQTDN